MRLMWKLAAVFVIIGAVSLVAAENLDDVLHNSEVQATCQNHYRLIHDGKFVGVLWENADPSKLRVGEEYRSWWGIRAPILDGDREVGQLRMMNESLQQGHHGAHHGNHGQYWQDHSCGNCDGSEMRHGWGAKYRS
ncbi:hypothetical protein Asulf_01017 [Archaeoglobus sulfaticallidus PM70-1]|uniref:Uncharacterized protein n=1 Tax=Archaeoglobus sulfaticallidus PM70-1 TaxID=387631 RepID=N0BKK1_9EURY|nr:hypothetical protein [Archaeoglobus sulfaticallidus]AGK61021.1 hypothetical protein Asulf_01017 [Archaeoglobus sulfaticallidus PM70-1]